MLRTFASAKYSPFSKSSITVLRTCNKQRKHSYRINYHQIGRYGRFMTIEYIQDQTGLFNSTEHFPWVPRLRTLYMHLACIDPLMQQFTQCQRIPFSMTDVTAPNQQLTHGPQFQQPNSGSFIPNYL